MRYYSAWTCRFISVDPIAGEYPFYTPYQYAGNRPINSVDIDGLEPSGGSPQGGGGGGTVISGTRTATVTVTINVHQATSVYTNGNSKSATVTNITTKQSGSSGTRINLETKMATGGATTVLPSPLVDNPTNFNPGKPVPDSPKGPGGGPMIPVWVGGLVAFVAAMLKTTDAGAGSSISEVKEKVGRMQADPDTEPEAFLKYDMEPDALATREKQKDPNSRWVTYTREGPGGQVYSGRAVGTTDQSPRDIVKNRYRSDNEKSLRGFAEAEPEASADGVEGYLAIRGREQQLIDRHGGAQKDDTARGGYYQGGGTSANLIRGVSRKNFLGRAYHYFSNKVFKGSIAKYTGL